MLSILCVCRVVSCCVCICRVCVVSSVERLIASKIKEVNEKNDEKLQELAAKYDALFTSLVSRRRCSSVHGQLTCCLSSNDRDRK